VAEDGEPVLLVRLPGVVVMDVAIRGTQVMTALTQPVFCRGQVGRKSPLRPLCSTGGHQPQQSRAVRIEPDELNPWPG